VSETPASPGGSALLAAELTAFPQSAVTVRVIDALLKVLPDTPAMPPYFSLEAAADALFQGSTPEVVARAHTLANEPPIHLALTVARSIDTGDTGLTIVTGVRSALSAFFGGAVADAPLAQQRADAALKALALGYLATRLIAEPGAERIERLVALPTGRALLAYYAAIEIAMPFHRELAANPDPAFVTRLVESQSRSIAPKPLGIIGREGVEDAQATLTHLLGHLDALVLAVLPNTSALAENVKGLLPSFMVPKGGADVSPFVASGADALPCYRFLVARLAIESCISRARGELQPAPEPAPAPAPAPAGAPALEAAPPAVANPFADEPAPPPPVEQPAPAPEIDVPTEPLPPEQRMVGVFVRAGPPESWLVFTREGVFSDWPSGSTQPDWAAHARTGRIVGRYRRSGEDKLEISWPDGHATTHALARDTYAITLDGESCRRADFNLQGQVLDGRWRLEGGNLAIMLFGDGTFAVSGGEDELPSGAGNYTLGTGAVSLKWEDGRTRELTLYSTLAPSARTPDRLLLGGRSLARV
jgi:hypothetical protein